jgi:hypothetical protein
MATSLPPKLAHARSRRARAVSILATILLAVLFVSEFRHFRLIETIDQLDVDVSANHGRIAINLDITLPSLPCGEFVLDVVDESGAQQLNVAETLNKLRVDRHGVPLDVPTNVDWGHTLAPAFRHRKVTTVRARWSARRCTWAAGTGRGWTG